MPIYFKKYIDGDQQSGFRGLIRRRVIGRNRSRLATSGKGFFPGGLQEDRSDNERAGFFVSSNLSVQRVRSKPAGATDQGSKTADDDVVRTSSAKAHFIGGFSGAISGSNQGSGYIFLGSGGTGSLQVQVGNTQGDGSRGRGSRSSIQPGGGLLGG